MKKLLLSLAISSIFIAGSSFAAGTGTCTSEKHATLQANVNSACKSQPIGCLGTDDKATLNTKIGKISACIDARKTINNTCFGGGDAGHKQAIVDLTAGITKCQNFLAKAK